MKKIAFLLTSALAASLLTTSAFAVSGEELLKKADMYLRFEENLSDEAGNVTVEEDGDVSYEEGRFGKAASIVSDNNSLILSDLEITNQSFTIGGWFNLSEHDGDPALFGNKNWASGGNPGFVMAVRSGDFRFSINTSGGTRSDAEYSFALLPDSQDTDAWVHVMVVVDRDNQCYTTYLNGNKAATTDVSGNGHDQNNYCDDTNGYPVYIGSDGTGLYNFSQTLNFLVDEFVEFNRALSAEEIQAIYTYAPAGEEAAVLASADKRTGLSYTANAADVLASAEMYLPFEGDAADKAGNHTTSLVGEVTYEEGKSGQGVTIDAAPGNYITTDYTFGTDSFTIMGWFRTNDFKTDPVLFGNKPYHRTENPGIALAKSGAGWKWCVNVDGGTSFDTAMVSTGFTDSDSDVGEWVHVAVVIDREAKTGKTYINGYPFSDATSYADHGFDGVAFDVEDLTFNIGNDGDGTYNQKNKQLNASFDDFAIFRRALTDDEIAAVADMYNEHPAAEEAPAAEEVPAAEETVEEIIVEEPVVVEEAPAAAEQETAPAAQEAAPQTFDISVIAAVAALISAAAYTVAGKKH